MTLPNNHRLNIKSLLIFLLIVILTISIASCATTGKSSSNLKSKDNKKTINKENNNKINNATQLIGNRNSKKLHNLDHPSCQNYVNMMNEENKVYFDSVSAANKAGYYSCKKCY